VTKSVHTKDYSQFLDLLIKARKEAGLTQAELAGKLERPQSYVSKYESGERRLDVVEFLDLAQAIGFDPAKLVKRLCRISAGHNRDLLT
jgi:transcriptional regulator with XRE-family HTH domain